MDQTLLEEESERMQTIEDAIIVSQSDRNSKERDQVHLLTTIVEYDRHRKSREFFVLWKDKRNTGRRIVGPRTYSGRK
jgi:hypothetical protein